MSSPHSVRYSSASMVNHCAQTCKSDAPNQGWHSTLYSNMYANLMHQTRADILHCTQTCMQIWCTKPGLTFCIVLKHVCNSDAPNQGLTCYTSDQCCAQMHVICASNAETWQCALHCWSVVSVSVIQLSVFLTEFYLLSLRLLYAQ